MNTPAALRRELEKRTRRSSLLAGLATVVVACSSIVGETPVETYPETTATTGAAPISTTSTTTTTSPPTRRESCVRVTQGIQHIGTGEISADALHLSGETFVCAEDVVVTSGRDLASLAVAAQLAAAVTGPLLVEHPQLAAEIGRLNPKRVHLVGQVEVSAPPRAEVLRHDIAAAAAVTAQALETEEMTLLPEAPDASVVVSAVQAVFTGDRVALPSHRTLEPVAGTTSSTAATPEPVYEPAAVIAGLSTANIVTSVWLVDAHNPASILLAAAYAIHADAALVAVDPGDLLGHPQVSVALAGIPLENLRRVGLPELDPWQLTVLVKGLQVPGGGFRILPQDQKRRFVAFYGHPATDALGVLGEQGPAETLQRMKPFLDAYGGDGSQVVPTFEMIAAVAAAQPTEDGDYSFEWPVATFMPWIETARANGAYVVLDLQSGRDDFLTQAQMYQELLELPFVGLALDPEWRLGPDQVHLRQTGSVTAAEANQVIDWVADLVRAQGLPQKMIIIHQFKHSMIRDRDTLKQRPEIQLIIQMDGEGGAGGEALKDRTYDALTAGTEDKHWKWGWKNFFDEDEPGPPPPENVMSKDPVPVYVSYQ